MERRVTPARRITSPTWGPPPPCKQAQSPKSEVYSKNAHGMCIQAGYWCEWTGATERGFITEKYHILGGGAGLLCFGKQGPGPRVASC